MRTRSGSRSYSSSPLQPPPAAALDEAAHDGGVAEAEEQQGLGRQAVAAGAAGLLVVALDGLGEVVVHDEAHVALVDAHAERDGGDDDQDLVAREGVLDAPPLVRRQAGVIGGGVDAVGAELVGDFFRALARQAVDDARLALVDGEELQQLVQRLALLDDGVADVGPVEAGDVDGGVGEPEPDAHVVARLGVGGGGAGHDGDAGEQAAQLPELDVLGPEVVAPLADAVRLVDGEQGDAGRAGGAARRVGQTAETLEEALGHERLGGDVQEVELAGVQGAQHAARLAGLERRVVGGGADAGRPQRVDLVLHQRDERRDDDARARPHHGGKLVAERLAAAGGHEHERVAAGHEMVDDLLLVLAVLGEAEDVAQQVASGARRSRGAGGGGGRSHASESSKVDGRDAGRMALARRSVMKYSSAQLGRVLVIRLEDGDVVHECIEEAARAEGIARAAVILLGGAGGGSRVVVGPEDGEAQPVVPMERVLHDVHEMAGAGTIFPDETGRPVLHLHAAFGRDDQVTAGCIRTGVKTWVVGEAVVIELTGNEASRRVDPATGFELLDA